MKKISLYIKLSIVTIMSIMVLSPAMVGASNKDAVCQGAGIVTGSATGCESPEGTTSVKDIVAKGLNLFSAVIGVVAIVMIMIGGIKYTTSQGDSSQVNNAKNTILYAAIGLTIAALAQVFVQFVLKKFGG
jgi:hypothetical protein